MKVNGQAVLLWYALCISWLVVQAGRRGKDEQRSRPKSDVKHRKYDPSHNFFSKKFNDNLHRPPTARGPRNKNDKRAFIRRKIQIKGAPKTVVVTVNGQRIDTNSGGSTSPVQPLPAPLPWANHPINLHINLKRKHFEGNIVGQRKQPIIITHPNPPRPIVIPIPMPAQTQPPQPVILPAPLPPPLPPLPVLPAPLPPPLPVPIPVPAPAPPPDKEDSDFASMLHTAVLLNTLGKKEESRPKIIPVMQPFIPPMAYQPPFMGYPSGRNLNQGYQGYPAGGSPNQGYPAGGNEHQGYPAGGNENQGYPAGGNLNQGYPAGGNENQGYPAGGSQNQGYPAGGNQNQGYPAGGNQNAAVAPASNNGSPLAGLNGILPLLLPFNCRCGCERRCPDLCNLCRGGVDEEIIDTLECCKTQPCSCLNAGAGTIQPAASVPVPVTAGTAVPSIGAPGPPVAPQPQQRPALPVAASTPAQPQPFQQSYPSLLPSQPVAVPPLPPLGQANPVSPLQPASAPPLPSQPASAPPLGAPPQPLPSGPGTPVSSPRLQPPLPPKPEIAPPAAEITPPKPGSVPPKPEIPVPGPPGSLTPTKPEIPVPGPPGSLSPPKPEIPVPGAPGLGVPLKPEPPGQGPVPETGTKIPTKPGIEEPEVRPGPSSTPGSSSVEGPGPPGSLVAPPPDSTGPIQLPALPPLLPGESAPSAPAAPNSVAPLPAAPSPTVAPPLPQLPLPKKAYPAPPAPPQVFIIKENSVSAKDLEDSKSAEALDNLSQSFENAFTKALKSQRKNTKLHYKRRRGGINQKPDVRENLDSEDEATENEENEGDEEKVLFYGGSRGDFEDHDTNEDSDISQENDNDDDEESEDDNDVDQNKADEEPPYDLDQPRYSHSRPSYEEDENQDLLRHDQNDQSRKRKKYLGLEQYGKNEDLSNNKADRHQLSYGRSENAFSNRYFERQGFDTHRESHPTLKQTNYDDRSQGFDFDSSDDESTRKVHRERHHQTLKTANNEFDSDFIYGETTKKSPSEATSVSSRRHKVRSKHFNSQKPRSKFKAHRKKHPTLKTANYDDRSRGYDIDSIYGETTQRVSSETLPVSSRRHNVRSKHFNSQKPRSKFQHYSKDLSVSHDISNFAHLQDRASHRHDRMHGHDHHSQHKQSKKVKKSHSKTKMIPEDEITEDVGSANEGNDISGDGERLSSFSTSGNYVKNNQLRTVKEAYTEGHKYPALTTVQFFKPGRHPKISKRKKNRGDKNIKEEDSYSSGEESGEKEHYDTSGDEYY